MAGSFFEPREFVEPGEQSVHHWWCGACGGYAGAKSLLIPINEFPGRATGVGACICQSPGPLFGTLHAPTAEQLAEAQEGIDAGHVINDDLRWMHDSGAWG